ncbi:MAG: hypothetical protein MUO82_05670 [Candidatus Thermoplasmatota archaeon]|nr:hypothetical protein [Candidatus Thermoplasmatota archaeon]
MLKFEKRNEKLIPRSKFFLRLVKYFFIALGIIAISLLIGIFGYKQFEGMSLVDAFLNSAMLMGGMGQIDTLHTEVGKVFAGAYALYCGFVVIISIGVFLVPIFHRFLHHFHLEGEFKKNES